MEAMATFTLIPHRSIFRWIYAALDRAAFSQILIRIGNSFNL